MGFWNFLRRKKPEEAVKVERELSLEEIDEKIKEEEKKLGESSAKIEESTKHLLDNLIPKLKDNLASLKSVTLEKRKEDESLKGIVMENVALYSSSLEKFIIDLEEINNKNYPSDYIIKINNIFESFSKGSAKSYQRATVLIGKEFEAIEKTFRDFFQEFKPVIKEDFENKKRAEKLSKLADKLHSVSESENAQERIRTRISELDAEKIQKEKEIAEKEEEIRNIKGSETYRTGLKEKEKAKEELEGLENDLQALQKKINLKDLARAYHLNEEKNKIIQDFIKDFKGFMEKDERVEFAKIIKESRGIDIDFAELVSRRKKLASYTSQSEIYLKELEKEIEGTKSAISETEKSRKAEEKKIGEAREGKENLIKELKLEAKEFFVDNAGL